MANSLPDATGYSGEVLVLSSDEYARLVEGDPVLSFYERVSARAVTDPQWSSDYRGATCAALTAEVQARVRAVAAETSPQSASEFTGDDFEAAIALQQAGTSFRC